MGKLAKAHSKPIIEFGIGAASQNVDNKHEVKEMGLSDKKNVLRAQTILHQNCFMGFYQLT